MAADRSSVQQALDRFKVADEADTPQRKREIEDLKFVDIPETQWPDDIRKLRAGSVVGAVSVAARPCLSLNQLDHPIEVIMNQARSARLAIKINPKSDATKDDAELRQGLYRNIEVESNAIQARLWAYNRALKCGRGFYRILTAYANDSDPDDQDIVIARILNQHSVYLDPFHEQPDGSDAMWAFIVADISFAKYKREFPDSDLANFEDEDFQGLGDDAPGWMNGEGEARTVRIAEYFSCTVEDEGRKVQWKWQKINGVEVLKRKVNGVVVPEEKLLDGRYLPIIQVIGKEININGERRYVGIVAGAKDAQRSYNYMRSAEVEAIALAPKAPWMMLEGQDEGFEQEWRESAVRNMPVLHYRGKQLGGQYAPPPKRNVEEPAIQAITLAARQAKDDVQTITGQFNEAQGKTAGGQQSGRAIQALQQQSEQGASGYLDNLVTISMPAEARIVLDLMPHIYDRAGRNAKILKGDDDAAESVILNAPFMRDPQTGLPQPLPPGTPFDPAQHEQFDLSKGSYSCTWSVGKSFTTRRQEANFMMGELAKAIPEMVPLYADVWVRNMDMPGGEEIADRFKKMLPPQLQEGDQAGNPAQLQQQVQQLTMQIQQMGQLLQDAQSGIAKAKIDADSRENIKAAEIASEEQQTAAKLASDERIAQMEADLAMLKESLKLRTEQAKIDAKQAETAMQLDAQDVSQARDHAHADNTHGVDLQHEVGMAHLGHAHATDAAKQAAKLKPKPAPR